MFTNGLLLNDSVLEQIAQNKNVVPLLSMEGYQIDTDGRRGNGVYNQLLKSIEQTQKQWFILGHILNNDKNQL